MRERRSRSGTSGSRGIEGRDGTLAVNAIRRATCLARLPRAMSTVKIPPVLRTYTDGERELSADGGNVGEVLRSLANAHPATEGQLFSEDGELNRYVNVYVNDEDVRVLDGLDTAVGEGDTLVILPAMAGGA